MTSHCRVIPALGCAIAWSLAPSSVAAPKNFTLVQEGRAVATIVISVSPSTNARLAALELRRCVKKISGAELPLSSDDKEQSGPLVLVGASRFSEKLPGVEIPAGLTPRLSEEGFVI